MLKYFFCKKLRFMVLMDLLVLECSEHDLITFWKIFIYLYLCSVKQTFCINCNSKPNVPNFIKLYIQLQLGINRCLSIFDETRSKGKAVTSFFSNF